MADQPAAAPAAAVQLSTAAAVSAPAAAVHAGASVAGAAPGGHPAIASAAAAAAASAAAAPAAADAGDLATAPIAQQPVQQQDLLPPPKPKASLLDTLLPPVRTGVLHPMHISARCGPLKIFVRPVTDCTTLVVVQDSGSRRSRRSAARASAASSTQTKPPAADGTAASNAAAAQTGAGSGVGDAPVRPDSGGASKAALLRYHCHHACSFRLRVVKQPSVESGMWPGDGLLSGWQCCFIEAIADCVVAWFVRI